MCEDNQNYTQELIAERAFIENLLSQRFNFFIVFFSLIVNAAILAIDKIYFKPILITGAIISWMISLTIFRSQQKLDILFTDLPEEHPAKKVNEKANKGWLRYSMRRIIGYYLPALCSLLLTIWAIIAIVVTCRK